MRADGEGVHRKPLGRILDFAKALHVVAMDYGIRRVFAHDSGGGRDVVHGARFVVDAHTAEIQHRRRRIPQYVRERVEIQHAARGGDAHEVIPLALQPQGGVFHGRMLPRGEDDGPGAMGIPFFGVRGAEEGQIVRFRAGRREDHAVRAHAVFQPAQAHGTRDLLPASREKFRRGQSGKMRGRGVGEIFLRRPHTVHCRLRRLGGGCVVEIDHNIVIL